MKKFLAIVLTFVLCFGVLSVALAAEDDAATSVPDGYIGIYTAEDLDSIRNNLSGKYILMNNIDLSSYENWTPIGSYEAPFTGELDGNGYAVKNLTISVTQQENFCAGLFGIIENATVKNLKIDDANINANADNGIYAGLICAEAYCSEILNCATFGEIKVETNSNVCVGGISGSLSSYTISGNDGITSVIEKCQNKANITIDATCNNDADGINYFSGGIVGFSDGIISECSNHGNINAIGKSEDYNYFYTLAGGICGNSDGEIANCYNSGNVSSTGTKYVFAGGITGHWYQFGNISSCHNVGEITAEVKDSTEEYTFAGAGGIIGETEPLFEPISDEDSDNNSISVSNCYYLDNIDKAYGDVIPQTSINVKSLSVEDFSAQSSFEGFDFDNIWIMDEKLGYPVFKWEYEEESPETTTNEPTTETTVPVTEPSTEESTTVPVATPIEPSTTQPTTEPTTAEVTTTKPTEPVTNPVTEPSTAEVTTQPVTEVEPTTEPSAKEESTTQPITDPTTEPTTEPSAEPDDDIGILAWLIKALKTIIDFIVKIFVALGC